MKSRRQTIALVVGATVAAMAVPLLSSMNQAQAGSGSYCSSLPQWTSGVWYYVDNFVQSGGNIYRAKAAHLSSSSLSPSYAPEKWAPAGSCSGGQPTPSGYPTYYPTDNPFPSESPSRSSSPSASPTRTPTPTPTASGKTPTPKPSQS
ncbi:hypothetical protein ACI2K4_04535 [Micromonospora sp. NPDC050397]|uniref:hypothetical protein n=1 Tax=Micromonospora sp. NPDC050397 TaxID=3364279 RepID=UPI0038517D89